MSEGETTMQRSPSELISRRIQNTQGPASYTNTRSPPRDCCFLTILRSDARSPPIAPKRRTSPPTSARVISIDSLCTSIPTNTVLDFSMACLLKVDGFMTTLWLCVRALTDTHVTHDTTEAGRLSLMQS